jgi:hypothetical protein
MSPDCLAHIDSIPPGELLQAIRQIAGEAQRGVVRVPCAAEGTDNHGAGMEPHSHGQDDPLRAPQVGGEGGERLLEPQRGMQRTHGVVFVGDGSPEDRPESVPSDEADAVPDPLDLRASG